MVKTRRQSVDIIMLTALTSGQLRLISEEFYRDCFAVCQKTDGRTAKRIGALSLETDRRDAQAMSNAA